MRVAYVCTDPGVPVFGQKGGSIHARSVLRALGRRGAEITLFARRLGGDAPAGLEAVRVVRLDKAPSKDPAEREPFLLDQNLALRRLLAEHGPFDLVYERHALWAYGAMEHARAEGVPGLLEVNAPLVDEQARYRSLLRADLADEAASRCFAAAGAMLAVSEPLARWLRSRCPDPSRVWVVPNGVDTDRFGPRARSTPAVTIGFVGSLRPWHGAEQLLEAYLSLHPGGPERRLRIVGDGPLMPWLQRRAARAGGSVELVGLVPPERIPAELAGIDIAVAPYPGMQSFYFSPLKLFEYMAAGCAILASASGQVSDVVENGVTGLLYEPDDLDGLRSGLERLLSDGGLRLRLGNAARDRAAARHSWDGVAGRVLEIARLRDGVPA